MTATWLAILARMATCLAMLPAKTVLVSITKADIPIHNCLIGQLTTPSLSCLSSLAACPVFP